MLETVMTVSVLVIGIHIVMDAKHVSGFCATPIGAVICGFFTFWRTYVVVAWGKLTLEEKIIWIYLFANTIAVITIIELFIFL